MQSSPYLNLLTDVGDDDDDDDVGTGILMSRPVEERPASSCTINQLHFLVWAGLISTNGTTTAAT